jgi:AraC family transcriptional regulator, positive regulator of tynA and feaB
MALTWTTDDVAAADRFAYWREVVCAQFVRMHPEQPGHSQPRRGFRGSVTTSQFGDVAVSHIVSDAQDVARTRSDIESCPGDVLFVNLQLEGTGLVEQSGHRHVLKAGDAVIVDADHPYRLAFRGSFRQACVRVPRSRIESLVAAHQLHPGRAIHADNAESALLSSLVTTVVDHPDGFRPSSTPLIEAQLVHALALAIGDVGSGGVRGSVPGLTHDELYRQAVLLIEARANERQLSPTAIAIHLGVSVRLLHQSMAEHSTSVMAVLRRARLDHVGRLLDTGESVTDAAMAAGFADLSTFHRAWRARFDQPPRRRLANDRTSNPVA